MAVQWLNDLDVLIMKAVMFIRLFSQSLTLLLLQWLVIKWLLYTGSVERLGDYFFYMSLLAPVFMFFSGHYKNYAAQLSKLDWPTAYKLRLIQVAFVAFTILLLLIGLSAFYVLSLSLFLLVVMLKLFELALDTRQAFEIRNNSNDTKSGQQSRPIAAFSAMLALLLLAAVAFSGGGAEKVIVISISALFLITTFNLLSVRTANSVSEQVGENSVRKQLKSIFITVGLPSLIIALIAAIPRLSLEFLASSQALAVFGSLLYFYLIAHIITINVFQAKINSNAIGLPIGPLLLLLLIGMVGLLVSIFLHQPIITLVFSEELAVYSSWLPWFIGFIILSSLVTYLEQTLIARLSDTYLLKLNLLVFSGALIICPVLVSLYQLQGAVGYMYLLFFSKLLLLWVYLKRNLSHG